MTNRPIGKYFLTALALMILAGIAYISFSQKPTAPNFEGETHEVILTEEGYVPKELTISSGDAVKFTTSRDEFFWPASNLHPTHEIYPEFDPRGPIKQTGSWAFKFDKAGTWKYHDHLNPSYTGTVVVKP